MSCFYFLPRIIIVNKDRDYEERRLKRCRIFVNIYRQFGFSVSRRNQTVMISYLKIKGVKP